MKFLIFFLLLSGVISESSSGYEQVDVYDSSEEYQTLEYSTYTFSEPTDFPESTDASEEIVIPESTDAPEEIVIPESTDAPEEIVIPESTNVPIIPEKSGDSGTSSSNFSKFKRIFLITLGFLLLLCCLCCMSSNANKKYSRSEGYSIKVPVTEDKENDFMV